MSYRSHRQQALQNYFDATDRRVRENPVCIDGQLLNTAAILLDDAKLRFDREINANTFANCPVNLDNGGVYYSLDLDPNYVLVDGTTQLNSITGTKNGVTVNLLPYDDRLPVPTSLILDPERSPVICNNPLLATITGSGDPVNPDLQTAIIASPYLAFPNNIHFWLGSTLEPALFVDIVLSGKKYPDDPWQNIDKVDTEVVQISRDGLVKSESPWIRLDSIVVRGLPVDGILTVFSNSFYIPICRDEMRPTSHPSFRDRTFPTYWQVDSDVQKLEEAYQLDNLTGLVTKQQYDIPDDIFSVVTEPNTWGSFAIGTNTLYYFDRREPLPGSLSTTGLTTEPCYGLEVSRSVEYFNTFVIKPVPYGNASLVNQYRYYVTFPDGTTHILYSDGSYGDYNPYNGWQYGAPGVQQFISFDNGTYVFYLECTDSLGNKTKDVYPVGNFSLSDIIKGTYDVSSLATVIVGAAFDFLNRLWLYDGVYAIPVKCVYNGYVIDGDGRKIYLTDNFDSITYS